MSKLICQECRHENEAERIYCHNCGARLDRNALTKEDATEEAPEDAHRRVRAMFDPHRDRLRRNFFQFSKLVLAALAAAALIEMLLPPDLPPKTKTIGLSAPIGIDLETASQAHGAQPLRYSEEQVNAYVASTLKNKPVALKDWPHFERALLRFDENLCRLTVERSLFGFSFYTAGEYHIAIQNGAISAVENAGNIGRLPVHPKLIKLCGGFLFGDISKSFDREHKLLTKMSRIDFQPKTVVVTPQP
ncbi:MAG: hypothetical protein ACJ8I9_06255 [Chthoniobacterales bacterium]|jgi:hypothetical protein